MINVERIAALQGHQNPVYTVESSNKPDIFFTGGNDKGVVEWSLEKMAPVKVLLPVKSSVYSLHTPKDSSLLGVGERSGQFTIFDLQSQQVATSINTHKLPIFDIRSVKRKQEILISSEDGTVSVIDLNTFALLYNFKVASDTVRCIAINPDESLVAFGCKDNIIRIYNLNDYTYIQELTEHTLPITSLEFTPDGRFLLSGSRDARLNIWDTTDFSLKESIVAHMFAVYDIKFHPSEPYFATASRDKSIKIWNTKTFRPHKTLSREKGIDAHSLSVNKIVWEANKERLISVSDDKLIMIWDIRIDV
jgi:centriolar protein POC1